MIRANNQRSVQPKLHLTNGYFVNFTSLALILRIVCQDQRKSVSQTYLSEIVGMTEKQVKYMCGIAQALGLIERISYKPTKFGRLVQIYDPHFDDKGTLWFMHYVISSNPFNLLWNRIVTIILPVSRNITREQIQNAFNDLQQMYTLRSFQSHITKELNTILDAYTNQQLASIAYIYQQNDIYVLNKGENIPSLVLCACIACFIQRHQSSSTTVSVQDLLNVTNGPGVILQLEESHFRKLLEQLKWQPGFSLESRADLDQVRLTDRVYAYEWMERYYASK